jgi:hypothetical protein
MRDHTYEVVEDHPHLIRDTYSKAISNRDTDAYTIYMNAASKRKERYSLGAKHEIEINNIKEEMSEVKDILRLILNKVNGN